MARCYTKGIENRFFCEKKRRIGMNKIIIKTSLSLFPIVSAVRYFILLSSPAVFARQEKEGGCDFYFVISTWCWSRLETTPEQSGRAIEPTQERENKREKKRRKKQKRKREREWTRGEAREQAKWHQKSRREREEQRVILFDDRERDSHELSAASQRVFSVVCKMPTTITEWMLLRVAAACYIVSLFLLSIRGVQLKRACCVFVNTRNTRERERRRPHCAPPARGVVFLFLVLRHLGLT